MNPITDALFYFVGWLGVVAIAAWQIKLTQKRMAKECLEKMGELAKGLTEQGERDCDRSFKNGLQAGASSMMHALKASGHVDEDVYMSLEILDDQIVGQEVCAQYADEKAHDREFLRKMKIKGDDEHGEGGGD